MKKNTRLNFNIFIVCLALLGAFARPAIAGWVLPANPGNSLIENLDVAILNLTNWLLGFTIAISVLAIIWGGLNYVFSSGDSQKIDLSKRIIYYSLIGLFISGVAYAFVNVIVTQILRN